jgi:hypothetical protein
LVLVVFVVVVSFAHRTLTGFPPPPELVWQAAYEGFIPPMIARTPDAKAVLARRSDLGQRNLKRVCFAVVRPLVGEDMAPPHIKALNMVN